MFIFEIFLSLKLLDVLAKRPKEKPEKKQRGMFIPFCSFIFVFIIFHSKIFLFSNQIDVHAKKLNEEQEKKPKEKQEKKQRGTFIPFCL